MANRNQCQRALTNPSFFVYLAVCFFCVALKSSTASEVEHDHLLAVVKEEPPVDRSHLSPAIEDRSKRSSEIVPDDVRAEFPEPRDKKVPRRFLGIRGKKAPASFLGMRGRRDDTSVNYLDDGPYAEFPSQGLDRPALSGSYEGGDFLKRAPSSFLGMRGKKARSNFLGMRGKKAPSGFLGMRGKKAPSGFLGMRGKKAPSGFLGMRGKKDYDNYDELNDALQELYEEEKRAPRGFLGMRGKKTPSDSILNDYNPALAYPEGPFINPYSDVIDDVINEKRAPSSFLGMRG